MIDLFQMSGGKKTAIIINEDATFNRVYAEALEEVGYHVSTFRDGKIGLARVLRERPDFVLTGIMVPTMNGYDILKVLREKETTAETPVIVCSHLTAPGTPEEQEAADLGATEVYYKAACTPEMILEAIG